MSTLIERDGNSDEAEYIGGIILRVDNFGMDSLEDRKIFQKTVYLIQAFDIPLGYDFNWYIHGVYSPDLADVGYALKAKIDEIHPTKFKDDHHEERFVEFCSFIDPIKQDVVSLEISSSLHYLHERNKEMDQDLLIEWLIDEKDLEERLSNGKKAYHTCEEEWNRLDRFNALA